MDPSKELTEERDRLRILLEVGSAVGTELEIGALLGATGAALRKVLPFARTDITIYDPEERLLRIHALVNPEGVAPGLLQEGRAVPVEGTEPGRALLARRVFVANTQSEILPVVTHEDERQFVLQADLRSCCLLPPYSPGRPIGTLNFQSAPEGAFDPCTVA